MRTSYFTTIALASLLAVVQGIEIESANGLGATSARQDQSPVDGLAQIGIEGSLSVKGTEPSWEEQTEQQKIKAENAAKENVERAEEQEKKAKEAQAQAKVRRAQEAAAEAQATADWKLHEAKAEAEHAAKVQAKAQESLLSVKGSEATAARWKEQDEQFKKKEEQENAKWAQEEAKQAATAQAKVQAKAQKQAQEAADIAAWNKKYPPQAPATPTPTTEAQANAKINAEQKAQTPATPTGPTKEQMAAWAAANPGPGVPAKPAPAAPASQSPEMMKKADCKKETAKLAEEIATLKQQLRLGMKL